MKSRAKKEAIAHTQEQRRALRDQRRAMKELQGPLEDHYLEAVGRLSDEGAGHVLAYVEKLWEMLLALNEVMYRECERRELAPAVTRGRIAAKVGAKPNAKRHAKTVNAAVDKYRAWEKRIAAALRGATDAEKLRKYLATRPTGQKVNRRDRGRLEEALGVKAGRVRRG